MILIHKGKLIDLVDAGYGSGDGYGVGYGCYGVGYADGYGYGVGYYGSSSGYGVGYGFGSGDGYCNEKDNGLEEIKTKGENE